MTTETKVKAAHLIKVLSAHVNTVLLARAKAEVERERMNAIDAALLQSAVYTDDDGVRITDPKKTWHIAEDAFKAYNAERQRRIDAAGYKLEPGYCPALVAEDELRKAERTMVDASTEVFPEFTFDNLMNRRNGLKTYREAVDLLVKLVVNAPGFVPVKMPA